MKVGHTKSRMNYFRSPRMSTEVKRRKPDRTQLCTLKTGIRLFVDLVPLGEHCQKKWGGSMAGKYNIKYEYFRILSTLSCTSGIASFISLALTPYHYLTKLSCRSNCNNPPLYNLYKKNLKASQELFSFDSKQKHIFATEFSFSLNLARSPAPVVSPAPCQSTEPAEPAGLRGTGATRHGLQTGARHLPGQLRLDYPLVLGFFISTKRYGPLRGPTSSSSGGLWP